MPSHAKIEALSFIHKAQNALHVLVAHLWQIMFLQLRGRDLIKFTQKLQCLLNIWHIVVFIHAWQLFKDPSRLPSGFSPDHAGGHARGKPKHVALPLGSLIEPSVSTSSPYHPCFGSAFPALPRLGQPCLVQLPHVNKGVLVPTQACIFLTGKHTVHSMAIGSSAT